MSISDAAVSSSSAYTLPAAPGAVGTERATAQDDVEAATGSTATAAASELITSLARARVYPSHHVFSKFVAWSNRLFTGIVAFGGGDDYTAGVVKWKYVSYHQLFFTWFTAVVAGPLYVAGASLATAVIWPILLMAPMMPTPFVETKIFRSPFLAVCIERGGPRLSKIKSSSNCFQLMFFLMGTFLWGGLFLSVSIFWCYPWAVDVPTTPTVASTPMSHNSTTAAAAEPRLLAQNSVAVQYIVLTALVLTVPMNFINYSFQFWQPIVQMHQDEVTAATTTVATAVQGLLFHETRGAKETRRELDKLTRHLVRPLQKELKVWGAEVFWVIVWIVILVACGVWLLIMPLSSRRPDTVWPGEAFRYTMAITCIVATPLGMLSLVHTAAKPHHEWAQVEGAMMQAGNLALACAKFDGNYALLSKWLAENRLTLKIVGFPVDETLPSKLAGGLFSLLGASGIIVVRSFGWV